jgi:hypothetical protein
MADYLLGELDDTLTCPNTDGIVDAENAGWGVFGTASQQWERPIGPERRRGSYAHNGFSIEPRAAPAAASAHPGP